MRNTRVGLTLLVPIFLLTDADLLITIRHGHPDTAMGAWRFALTEKEVWDVLAYVRTLQK